MERNVDKIKRLEHELGRWRKKVADTAKENEELREALAQADAGNQETQALVDAVLTAVVLEHGEQAMDPDAPETSLAVLQLRGTNSIVTSGGYQRYFTENGQRYHHILDPATGRPADSGLASVTIVAKDGLLADALSTALFVMGLDEAAAFWQESDDFEAVLIDAQGQVYVTSGLEDAITGCDFTVIDR